MEKQNVPTLRFREFDSEWSESTLKQLSSNVSYGIGAAATDYDGINKYLRITDIDEESRRFLPNPLTSPEGSDFDKYKLVKDDIVFARTGASVGKSYLYNPADGNLIYAGFLIKFHIDKADPQFVYLMTFRSEYNKWVQVYSMRSGQPGLNAEEYKKWDFFIPKLPEQQKIASFLSAVDTKIEQLTRKKELLEEYKKGVMQKLFPPPSTSSGSGEVQHPELRFKQEDGSDFPDWEVKRLGELGSFSKGKGISKSDISDDGKYHCIRYGELYTDYREIIMDVISKTNIDPKDSVISEANDVIIPSSGETHIDIATASCVLVEGVLLGGDLNIFSSKENGVFISYLLNNAYKFDIANLAQGNSVVHLYSKQLKSLQIMRPSLSEQNRISDFIAELDSKIAGIEVKVANAQSFKKGLLQQMFV